MIRCAVLIGLVLPVLVACGGEDPATPASAGFVGSRSCRSCHERFYELWAPSHHGTAMQPFTPEFAGAALTPQKEPLEVEGASYHFDLQRGAVVETAPDGERSWPIAHVMGGKNVYFLLTPLDRGRLQVLPVAYDVDEALWYDTTESMIRHALGHPADPVDWRDPLLTFNTSCWGCHVSQLTVNYDPETDTYASTWAEPGINCETCHGPAGEHVRVCEEAAGGEAPADLKIVRVSAFDERQTNDTCAPCHAKAIPLTADFRPGDRYFDHFDLTCLEDLDFHPDGRDLGENYTFTLWRMSPCAVSGRLDCVHCHTSSGRTRFLDEHANEACLPCHADHVDDAPAHTHHREGSAGNRCTACHMPMTEFARMRRSDHSMRPPAPALTLAYGSPNACNLCHADQTAEWADEHVRAWRSRDYQAPMLAAAGLVDAARRGDWTRRDEILAYVTSPGRDEVVATSLLRLLAALGDEHKIPAFLAALRDPSPLVRAAAASGLEGWVRPDVLQALLVATADDVRLVRVRAAGALAGLPPGDLPPPVRESLTKATAELEAALAVRADSWTTYYNLGNLHERRGEYAEALKAYEHASRLRPDVVAPWVNAAMIHARMDHLGLAENALRRALQVEPENAPANFNLGLLLAERGSKPEARACLRRALESDPDLAAAAYNLASLVVEDDPEEGRSLYRRAWEARPGEVRFAHAYASALVRAGEAAEARRVLGRALSEGAASAAVYALLADLHEKAGDRGAARATFARAAEDPRLSHEERQAFAARLEKAQ